MATTPDAFHCPHCGRSISDQETSSSELFSYIEQLESFARIPVSLQEALRTGKNIMASLRLLPVLVVRMDHYFNLVNQHATNVLDKERAEMYASLLNRALRVIIPIIDQGSGFILEFGYGRLSAVWGSPMLDDEFTKAVSTALEIQEILLKLEELAGGRDFALKMGIADGWVHAGTIGTSTHQNFSIIGPPVIEAARLSDVAEPGQILVSHAIYERTKDEIVYKQLVPKSKLAVQDIQPQHYLALCRKE
jgi:class 3 adenylate cyclase